MSDLKTQVHDVVDGALGDLRRLLAQPSIAASGEGIDQCAGLVADLFTREGARTQVLRSGTAAPFIVAEFPGRETRTLLFYDHYDVQPPEPIDEWTTPPFLPVVRDGKLYARGAADNKGDLVSRIAALRALRAVYGELPCRITFIVEGEEEIGSIHFDRYVREHHALLRGDACIWEAGMRDLQERLELVAGVKGICYLDLALDATARDLHSSVGAIVEGAATKLSWALASLKDPVSGRVRVAGFYDRVREPTERERALIRAIRDDEAALRAFYGVTRWIGGKDGEAAQQDLYFAPTCTVCGFQSGYTGPGSKTVLPRRATAKVDFRLVPDQDPEEIAGLVRRHFDAQGFGEITVTLLGGEHPYRAPVDDPFIQMVADVAGRATGREVTLRPTSPGTGPMHPVGSILKVPIISLGGSYIGSRAHAPDEHIRLADFEETVYMMARIIEAFAAGNPPTATTR